MHLSKFINSLKSSITIFLGLLFTAFTLDAQEKNFIQWHSSNIQLLRGYDFELGNQQRTITTFEHVNSWKYGDFYIFGDYVWPDTGDTTYYIEPTLRLSYNKITGSKINSSLVKDVFFAAQLEKPKNQSGRPLAGLAVDLNLPGFTFFKTMLFWRDNPDIAGDTQQLTIAWNYPFEINGLRLLTEGFADFSGPEGPTVSNQLFVPRLLADIGVLSGLPSNKLWVGIEWQYWHNKFGVEGVTESVPQIQIKYVF